MNEYQSESASITTKLEELESEPSSSLVSVNMPNIQVNIRPLDNDDSYTKCQSKQCTLLGRKHDFQCRNNSRPQVSSEEEVEHPNFKNQDSKYQKSVKRMSPQQTVKIKKEKHRMRTRSNRKKVALSSPVVENAENSQGETAQSKEESNSPLQKMQETNLNSKENFEDIVIDSSTSFDVFMIMFLVGLYASRQYGQKSNTNS